MIIDKKLNLDSELEYMKDGSLVFASNIVLSKDGLAIQNEPAITNFIDAIEIDYVGHIACNEEFVVFGKDSSIRRINKDKTVKVCDTNWKWAGGKVFGTFTYNVNNELIIAISERELPEGVDCPLKIINLDRDKFDDSAGESVYTLTPDIPKSNMIDVGYVTGNKIRKGKYNFFIKYYINDDFETAWFPIGVPVFAYDNSKSDTPKTTEHEEIQAYDKPENTKNWNRYFIHYDDFYNEDSEYTNDNIKLDFEINDELFYTHYSIGYIISYNGGTEGRKTNKYSINTKTIIISETSEPESVDELTVGAFNIFNVKTMCNYKDRLYLANYKEENPNKDVETIDASNIIVSYRPDSLIPNEIFEYGDGEGNVSYDYNQLKNQWKSKPGRAAVYNFYIHYVYPNGNYTDGIKIGSVENHPNGGMLDDGIIALEHYINSSGDLLFITPINKTFNVDKLIFSGIKMYPQFVGYFISYEKPEYINIGEGFIAPNKSKRVDNNITGTYKYTTGDLFPLTYTQNESVWRFYYPEFNIIGGKTNVTKLVPTGIHRDVFEEPAYIDNYTRLYVNTARGYLLKSNSFNNEGTSKVIKKSEVISPTYVDNIGKEGYLKLISEEAFDRYLDGNDVETYTAINENNNLYLNEVKQLVSLGYVKYQPYVSAGYTYSYGEENVPYNYDFYRCYSSIYFFRYGGIIINETESNPIVVQGMYIDPTLGVVNGSDAGMQYRDKGSEYYSYERLADTRYYPHIGIIKYWHETHYPLFLKEINQEPQILFRPNYEVNTNATGSAELNFDKIYQIQNTVLSPNYINDLYKLDACYYDYTGKLFVNYDKSLISNQMVEYTKTVRRSDVLQSESVDKAWRHFRPENYKVITEDKGVITNVVGIGHYLFVHCEHSLFVFDINDSLKALDKDVQLLQPDTFDVNYKEIFTSDKGYGGLQDFESWICDEFGYVFYNRDSKKIHRFDNGQLLNISNNIDDFINAYLPDKIYIGSDRERNRLLFNFRGDKKNCILSYNVIYNAWLSTHSYQTNNNFINLKDKIVIPYSITNFAQFKEYNTDKFNSCGLPVGDVFKPADINESYIDVCFTGEHYNRIKVLDFITYILNKEPNDKFETLKLEIYSNCCYSGIIDISKDRTKVSEYDRPYYDFERWNFNWFRNRIDKIENGDVVNRLTGINNNYPEKVQRGYDNALMSGKYIVVRFRFKNTTKEINIKDIQAYFKL